MGFDVELQCNWDDCTSIFAIISLSLHEHDALGTTASMIGTNGPQHRVTSWTAVELHSQWLHQFTLSPLYRKH